METAEEGNGQQTETQCPPRRDCADDRRGDDGFRTQTTTGRETEVIQDTKHVRQWCAPRESRTLSAQVAHVSAIRDADWKTATGSGPLVIEVTWFNSDRKRPEEIRSASGRPSSAKTPTLGEPAGRARTNPTCAAHNPDS